MIFGHSPVKKEHPKKNPICYQLADFIPIYLLQKIHGRNVLFFTVNARLLNSNNLVFMSWSANWVSYSKALKSPGSKKKKKYMKCFAERTPLNTSIQVWFICKVIFIYKAHVASTVSVFNRIRHTHKQLIFHNRPPLHQLPDLLYKWSFSFEESGIIKNNCICIMMRLLFQIIALLRR